MIRIASYRETERRRQVLSLLVKYHRLSSGNFYHLMAEEALYDYVGDKAIASHERSTRYTLELLIKDHFVGAGYFRDYDRERGYYRHDKRLFWLTPKGLKCAKEWGLDPENEGKANEKISRYLLEHEDGITQIHLALEKACRARGYILHWRQKLLKKSTVNPDAYFSIELPKEGVTFDFFLEYENSTEGHYTPIIGSKKKENESQLMGKMREYYAYQRSEDGTCQKEWGFNQFFVFTVMKRAEWVEPFLGRMSKLYQDEMFRTASLEDVIRNALGPIYQTPKDYADVKYPLVA